MGVGGCGPAVQHKYEKNKFTFFTNSANKKLFGVFSQSVFRSSTVHLSIMSPLRPTDRRRSGITIKFQFEGKIRKKRKRIAFEKNQKRLTNDDNNNWTNAGS